MRSRRLRASSRPGMFLKLVEAFCAHELFEFAGEGRGVVVVGRRGWLA